MPGWKPTTTTTTFWRRVGIQCLSILFRPITNWFGRFGHPDRSAGPCSVFSSSSSRECINKLPPHCRVATGNRQLGYSREQGEKSERDRGKKKEEYSTGQIMLIMRRSGLNVVSPPCFFFPLVRWVVGFPQNRRLCKVDPTDGEYGQHDGWWWELCEDVQRHGPWDKWTINFRRLMGGGGGQILVRSVRLDAISTLLWLIRIAFQFLTPKYHAVCFSLSNHFFNAW